MNKKDEIWLKEKSSQMGVIFVLFLLVVIVITAIVYTFQILSIYYSLEIILVIVFVAAVVVWAILKNKEK